MTQSLTFPFRADLLRRVPKPLWPAGTTQKNVVVRQPVLPLRVHSPDFSGNWAQVGDALIDSGSVYTLLLDSHIDDVGIAGFVHSTQHQWKGNSYSVRFAKVQLELHRGGTSFIWPAVVGFTAAPLPYGCLLGLLGFIEMFEVTMFGTETLEIQPRTLFHTAGGQITKVP